MYKYFTELVDFVGSRPKPFDNTKKYISTGALKTNNISEDDVEMIDYATRPSRADLEVKNGDILFAKMAFTDKRLLVNDIEASHIYSTGFFAVKPKDGILTAKCLYYLLSSETFKNQKDANSTGATQKAITIEGLKKIKLRVPKYNKQDRIGSVLENIERIIKYKQQQLSEYDQLIKSRFVEMFGDVLINERSWPMSKWNDVLVIKNGKNQKKVENKNGKYPIFGSGGVMSYADDYICNENSVIIGRKGNINNPILMREKYWNVDTAFGLEPHINRISVDYLYMFCTFYNFLKHNKTVTIPSLTKTDLLKIDIPTPPLRLQDEFSKFVKQVDKLKFDDDS